MIVAYYIEIATEIDQLYLERTLRLGNYPFLESTGRDVYTRNQVIFKDLGSIERDWENRRESV